MSQKLGFSRISRMEESSVLTEFVDRMIRITDDLVDQIKIGQLDGEFHFHQNSLQSAAAGETVSLELLCEIYQETGEREKLLDCVSNYFRDFGEKKISLENLRKIVELIKEAE